MSVKKNIVTLSVTEREELEKVARSNHRSIREKRRARMLLLADVNGSREQGASRTDEQGASRTDEQGASRTDEQGARRTDSEIAQQLGCAPLTVSTVRARAAQRGVLTAVSHGEQANRKARKLDGQQEAQLVALTCSAPPQGCSRWSLVLLRERMIELEIVEHIGLETIRSTLKKTHSSHG